MKILHVYKTYFPDSQGGLEEVIRQICGSTLRLGVENRVLSVTPQKMPLVTKRVEANVYRLPRSFSVASADVSWRALFAFKKHGSWADLVHFHFPWPFADVMHLFFRLQRPSIVTYHSDIVRQKALGILYYPLMHKFLKSVDRIVCTSPNYLSTSRILARHVDKTEVIPIGLEEETYPAVDEGFLDEIRDRHGEDFFLFIGVLRYYKGLHILLDSLKNAPYRVIIAGTGPMETDLKRKAIALGLRNVTFAGYVDDKTKVALFRLCRAVVFPSHLRSEAFGVTLLEGAMFGKPLISTEIGTGTSYINLNEKTGLVVPPNSAISLRQAMDRLWADPGHSRTLGMGARLRFEKLFTGELMGRRYYELYSGLIEERNFKPHSAVDTRG